jgi:hypothetical protein
MLSVVGSTVLLVFGLAVTGEWTLGVPILLVFLAFWFATSAWAWKVDQLVEKWLDKRLAMKPETRDQIERNVLLRMFTKHRH